jgi:hypothetical protein
MIALFCLFPVIVFIIDRSILKKTKTPLIENSREKEKNSLNDFQRGLDISIFSGGDIMINGVALNQIIKNLLENQKQQSKEENKKKMLKNQFILRKTKPKKGLPDGAWVCFSPSVPHKLIFGNTPQEALEKFINKKD